MQRCEHVERARRRLRSLGHGEVDVRMLRLAYYFRLSDPARKALMLDRYLRLASSGPTFDTRCRPGLGDVPAVLDEIEACVLEGLS